MSVERLKISVSGVRGVVGESLSPGLICRFAAAFGEYVGGGRVVVGRDTRRSGPMYEQAVIAGLLSVGCQPMLVGIVPTPTVQVVVDDYNASGGIVITASHNPMEWNALKLIGPSGTFLNNTEAQELLDVYNQPQRHYVPETQYRKTRTLAHAFDLQKKRIFKNIDVDLIRKAHFKVAVDCCNGAGAPYAKAFLEELGCEVVPVFEEIDGLFHRKTEPIPENLTKLSEVTAKEQCAIGFAQDPDADRIVVVNSSGKPIGEQYSIVLATAHILSKTPGPVVVNIQTTKAVEAIASKYNCPLEYSPVGEINVTDRMLKNGAVIGGEGGSGGIIWPTMHPCRDSFTGMALILEMLATRKQSLEQILSEISYYYSQSEKVPCSGEQAQIVIRHLREKYQAAHPNIIDGLRLDWEDSWVLIRPSNTEPIMRIYAEATTQAKAIQLTQRLVEEIHHISST